MPVSEQRGDYLTGPGADPHGAWLTDVKPLPNQWPRPPCQRLSGKVVIESRNILDLRLDRSTRFQKPGIVRV
jgi:hypothetical protein